jgi:hypothetical protein
MRRVALLGICLAVLAACGTRPAVSKSADDALVSPLDAFYAGEPRLALPLKAPEGVDPNLKSFLEICSLALVDEAQGVAEAGRRGWLPLNLEIVITSLSGMVTLIQDGGGGTEDQIQISRADYPHFQAANCSLVRFRSGVPESLSLAPLSKLAGLRGSTTALPKESGLGDGLRGLYSFVTPEGHVVSLSVIYSGPLMLNLNMSMARFVRPAADPSNKP